MLQDKNDLHAQVKAALAAEEAEADVVAETPEGEEVQPEVTEKVAEGVEPEGQVETKQDKNFKKLRDSLAESETKRLEAEAALKGQTDKVGLIMDNINAHAQKNGSHMVDIDELVEQSLESRIKEEASYTQADPDVLREHYETKTKANELEAQNKALQQQVADQHKQAFMHKVGHELKIADTEMDKHIKVLDDKYHVQYDLTNKAASEETIRALLNAELKIPEQQKAKQQKAQAVTAAVTTGAPNVAAVQEDNIQQAIAQEVKILKSLLSSKHITKDDYDREIAKLQ